MITRGSARARGSTPSWKVAGLGRGAANFLALPINLFKMGIK